MEEHMNRPLESQDMQPAGGRIGVSFDWGFAVSLILTAFGSLSGRPIGPTLSTPVALGSLVVAALMLWLGEALRRGNGIAYRIQIVFHSLLVVIGLTTILPAIEAIQQGRFAELYTLGLMLLLMLVVSPIELWLLLRPGSRRWYGKIAPSEAIKRHSGSWLVGTIVWAVVCGFLQAIAP
jgi:glycerol uptake facilitator-like aquaporin